MMSAASDMAGSGRMRVYLDRLNPVWGAFCGSLLLSLIAVLGAVTPNNDGMLYVEAARVFQQSGLGAAREVFDWVFLPVLMSALSSVTRLDAGAAGYVISALFLAGTCALLVSCVRERFPEAGWAACAVVLAIPALNNYRDYIIREFGAWFFIVLALWLALRWVRKPGWWLALLAQVSICAAALFRLECLIFLAVFPLWQLGALRREGGVRRLTMMSVLPLVGALSLGALLVTGVAGVSERLIYQLSALELFAEGSDFRRAADLFADSVLSRYSADEATTILLFGLLSIIPVKLLSNLGFFVLPAMYAASRLRMRDLCSDRSSVWLVAFCLYALVLSAFVLKQFFLTSRYVAPLAILMVPLVSLGAHALYCRFTRLRWILVVFVVILALANVISTSPPKTRYLDAARWLQQQHVEETRVYLEPREVAHLVGWSFRHAQRGLSGRSALLEAMAAGRIDLALLEGREGDPAIAKWASDNRLRVLQVFVDGRGRAIFVIGRDVPELD